ncbi:MAG: lysine--tRNA ligase [Candidatus Woesearchaeota archaeon]
MQPENQLIKDRLNKLANLQNQGIEPFPHNFSKKKQDISKIKKEFDGLESQTHTGKQRTVAGRIMLLRNMGKAAFITIKDDFDTIQLYLRKQDTKNFDILTNLDIGDFIGAKGEVFTTKVGELTIYANYVEFLAKATRPLPDKHHGLQDTELKYRKRHLDLIMNKETEITMTKRLKIMAAIREFFTKKGFLEVETPILHPIYGGAAAKPFKTYHNELKSNLYLRISPELYLKRLIVGGYSKVYDINKNFRNEGIDTTHNPEFTMLEAYQTYADYNDMMSLFEELYEFVALKVNGTTKTLFKGKEVDVKAPWSRIPMLDSIKKYAKIDASNMSEKELYDFVKKNKVKFDKEVNWGNLVAAIFEEYCEDKYTNPVFIIDHPKETTPLCKAHRNDPRLIERFEPFSCGMELGNAYSELNDPIHQRKLLEDQARQLKGGDEEANPMDEDFLEAIEHGMPPTGGVGIGLDRMIMLLLGKDSIRDVIFFPTMKPGK